MIGDQPSNDEKLIIYIYLILMFYLYHHTVYKIL